MVEKGVLLKTLFSTSILLLISIIGCIEKDITNKPIDDKVTEFKLDHPLILPDWKDGEYHDYFGTVDKLNELNSKYSNSTHIFTIGESILGKDIWCIRITNENSHRIKSSCLIDGCIHGNEWESGEACLYLAEFLLINNYKNSSISNILNKSVIYIVPLVNPDGRQDDKRWNNNGVDLNRNFDVFFGKIRGRCIPIGKLFGIIKIPYIKFPRLGIWFSNSGRRAFSEPESKAIMDLTKELDNQDFSFYVNCHTAVHTVGAAWLTHKPPFDLTNQERIVGDYVLDWVDENTEYESFRIPLKVGGVVTDWCFKEYHIPSFCFEILAKEYEPFMGHGKHDNLVHWMKTTLPFFMFLIVNIDNLRQWKIPYNNPSLPEDIPPDPI
jgi:hypothetical protein